MANNSSKIREWSQRHARFQKSKTSIVQFCHDEEILSLKALAIVDRLMQSHIHTLAPSYFYS